MCIQFGTILILYRLIDCLVDNFYFFKRNLLFLIKKIANYCKKKTRIKERIRERTKYVIIKRIYKIKIKQRLNEKIFQNCRTLHATLKKFTQVTKGKNFDCYESYY